MKRIRQAFAGRFRTLLARFGARRVDAGVAQLLARADQHLAQSASLTGSLIEVERHLLEQLRRFNRRKAAADSASPGFQSSNIETAEPAASRTRADSTSNLRFICDGGLGGLARWLRAAGYDAAWDPEKHDAEIVRQAARENAALLTTDSLLMERRVVQRGQVRAYWLPPTLSIPEQLQLVFREFDLQPRPPRCMKCGGEVARVEKESVRDRIPPRTYRWLDEYFICQRCGQLFWHGTHWRRIQERIASLAQGGSDAPE
jgi:uncharacterized protein